MIGVRLGPVRGNIAAVRRNRVLVSAVYQLPAVNGRRFGCAGRTNRAIQFCKLPRAEQLEQFIRYSEERATNKVIRQSIARPKEEKTSLDTVTVLDALQQQEARQPGSVAVRVGRHKHPVVLIGQDLFAEPPSQKELKLT